MYFSDEEKLETDYFDDFFLQQGKPRLNKPKLEAEFAQKHYEVKLNTRVLQPNVISSFNKEIKHIESTRIRIKDKQDRETVEQVLDPKTRLILYKLIKQEKLVEVQGCISTGKEANVYYAYDNQDKEYGVKIYKTSILKFKDRDQYVTGEYRFKGGYSRSNPRKMVKLWAEKEFRNLKRIYTEGVLSPEPLILKQHVLIMSFIGEEGNPAPRLKDAETQQGDILYLQSLNIMQRMFQKCKLVHADFSEYNLLVYKDNLYVIDVSQAVEWDHPRSLDFLRRDIANINNFFRKKFVPVCQMQHVFDWITSPEATLQAEELQRSLDPDPNEGIFSQIYIPQSLFDVEDEQFENGLHQTVEQQAVINKFLKVEIQEKAEDQENDQEEECSQENEGSNEEKEEGKEQIEEEQQQNRKFGDVKYEGLSKQERKQKVKEEKREKRKNKIPKAEKKKFRKKAVDSRK